METGEPLTVRIPPGADEGNRLRVPGQGGPGHPRGDLYLVIHVRPHPLFRREGDDLYVDVPLTPAEAYRGGKVRVPTPTSPSSSVTLMVTFMVFPRRSFTACLSSIGKGRP